MKVAVNEFVRRQVKGSGKTYSKTMSFEAIAEHAQIHNKMICFEYCFILPNLVP